MSQIASKPKTYPFTIRFTAEQKALLKSKASDLPLGEYMRRSLLNEPIEAIDLPKDQVKLVASWVLGGIGQSRYAEHLGSIAQSAQQGLVILSPEESAVVIQACADISAIRHKLMRVLGHRKAANDY
ncbi:hypothetical protein AB835_14445 [Candidatus Endobugula sertula]|uniref:Uncharacterized protein n=1 Tax=Candidatus Endobugula sertula TaxID=62101 RepID=A0A1D2QLD7_9GAMM|nr:hypothetical protein AB835_14445 [Candidatus Endobugula sertula]